MKKSALKKPLHLSTQTLRRLTAVQLDVVGGGALAPSHPKALSCGTAACDTTPWE